MATSQGNSAGPTLSAQSLWSTPTEFLEYCFKIPFTSSRFPYHLRIEGRAKLWFHSDLPREMHPKYICELRISIRHNYSRQPVVPSPTFENWLCGLQRGYGSHDRHHVCQLGKPSYHHQDGIISLWLQQTCYQVHAHTMSWLRRNRQRLQEAALILVRDSVHLASTQAFTKWTISSFMHGQ
jgi:hypothetical protein